MPGGITSSRRTFLARCGLLGAALATAGLPGSSPARATARGAQEASDALRSLTLDTIAGLVAFGVPGMDPYSRAQGVTHPTPGGVDARGPEGIVALFDRVMPVPDSFAQAMVAAFAAGASEAPLPGLAPLLDATEQYAAELDRALQDSLANDETVPLSLLVALTLNLVATEVDPASVVGPFPTAPFANLDYAQKAEVMRRLEEDHEALVALLDSGASEPMKRSLSGQIRFIGGALPAAAALFGYAEWGVLDAGTAVATKRPVGWDNTGYAPGRSTPADGWDELKGYYGARRKATRTRRRKRRRRRSRRA